MIAVDVGTADFGVCERRAASRNDGVKVNVSVQFLIPRVQNHHGSGFVCQFFFDNDKVSPEKVREPHVAATIEDKESIRWIEGLRKTRDVAALCPDTQCVCVSDSESDIYEMFSEPRSAPSFDDDSQTNAQFELVIRAGQIRTTSHGDWLSEAREADEQSSDQLNVSARVAKSEEQRRTRTCIVNCLCRSSLRFLTGLAELRGLQKLSNLNGSPR